MADARAEIRERILYTSASGRQLVTEDHLIFIRKKLGKVAMTRFPLQHIRRISVRPAFDWPRVFVLLGLGLGQLAVGVLASEPLVIGIASVMCVAIVVSGRSTIFSVEDMVGETSIKMGGRRRDIQALMDAAESQADALKSRPVKATFRPAAM